MARNRTSPRPVTPARLLLTLAAIVALVAPALALGLTASAATANDHRVWLRALVLDDGSPWIDAMEQQLSNEGVPATRLDLSSASRPAVTAAFLASGESAFFQTVIVPEYTLGGSALSEEEKSALRAYEAHFGIRQVDGYDWANPAVGLNYAGFVGDPSDAGITPTVSAAGQAGGFGYLNGPVPFSPGSYSYIAEPLSTSSTPPLPAGASFTTLVSAPIPGTTATGSVIGAYAHDGIEQLVVTAAFNAALPQFKLLAHGILTWATRGVHLGYNRNYMTFHVDDGFSSISVWDPVNKCTPGEDCPPGSNVTESSVRMTSADVDYAVQWQAANNYRLTIPFNAAYAASGDPLTTAFKANAGAFNWMNHGFEHIYQGCVQDFSSVPWKCATDGAGNIQWVSQATIESEIRNNIAAAQALGLPFDASEYLSGEHSGLAQLPQMPTDNPNFGPALAASGIMTIGADASREPGQRTVGGARTVPRHPTAIFYNAATEAQEISEYNWFYTTRANGGSGYCEDNPATATCIDPLDASGFDSYIVPTDAAFDLQFILGNDPRPFYAHTSNLTSDRILYPLLETLLSRYRAAFKPSAPLVNLSLTQAATALARKSSWAATGLVDGSVSGYVENGRVTITNPGTAPAPVTVPAGTSVSGVVLEAYGGELSGWVPGSASGTLPAPAITTSGSTAFEIGSPGTLTITASGTPSPSITMTGALPAGLTFTPGAGLAAISGIPAAGTVGSYPIVVTATSGSGAFEQAITLTVRQPGAPQFTSAASATATVGKAFTFKVMTSGTPTPAVTRTGTLPSGVTFTASSDGTATLAGTAKSGTGGTYPLTFTATNTAGSATQAFSLSVAQAPTLSGPTSVLIVLAGQLNLTYKATGVPTPALSISGSLPPGATFTAATDGTARITGRVTRSGSYKSTVKAVNSAGSATRALTITVLL